eukprot:1023155-Pelagomonas_calceolata.AAC.2
MLSLPQGNLEIRSYKCKAEQHRDVKTAIQNLQANYGCLVGHMVGEFQEKHIGTLTRLHNDAEEGWRAGSGAMP